MQHDTRLSKDSLFVSMILTLHKCNAGIQQNAVIVAISYLQCFRVFALRRRRPCEGEAILRGE